MASPPSRPRAQPTGFLLVVPWETWPKQVLANVRLGPYVDEQLATMVTSIARIGTTA